MFALNLYYTNHNITTNDLFHITAGFIAAKVINQSIHKHCTDHRMPCDETRTINRLGYTNDAINARTLILTYVVPNVNDNLCCPEN
jgi:hypothetical protein